MKTFVLSIIVLNLLLTGTANATGLTGMRFNVDLQDKNQQEKYVELMNEIVFWQLEGLVGDIYIGGPSLEGNKISLCVEFGVPLNDLGGASFKIVEANKYELLEAHVIVTCRNKI